MKEVTRIITARMTVIGKTDNHKLPTKEGKIEVAKMIEDAMDFDDVVIDNVQDFVREVEE